MSNLSNVPFEQPGKFTHIPKQTKRVIINHSELGVSAIKTIQITVEPVVNTSFFFAPLNEAVQKSKWQRFLNHCEHPRRQCYPFLSLPIQYILLHAARPGGNMRP